MVSLGCEGATLGASKVTVLGFANVGQIGSGGPTRSAVDSVRSSIASARVGWYSDDGIVVSWGVVREGIEENDAVADDC
jgi:hypothetical protein